MQENELMTVVEAAGYLGVHSMTLHKWTRQGKFKVTRAGHKNYLDPVEVKAFKAEAETLQIKKATELLTISKAALYLGVHAMTVYRWIKAGQLKQVKVGWQMYLPIEDVETIKARLDAQGVHVNPLVDQGGLPEDRILRQE